MSDPMFLSDLRAGYILKDQSFVALSNDNSLVIRHTIPGHGGRVAQMVRIDILNRGRLPVREAWAKFMSLVEAGDDWDPSFATASLTMLSDTDRSDVLSECSGINFHVERFKRPRHVTGIRVWKNGPQQVLNSITRLRVIGQITLITGTVKTIPIVDLFPTQDS